MIMFSVYLVAHDDIDDEEEGGEMRTGVNEDNEDGE